MRLLLASLFLSLFLTALSNADSANESFISSTDAIISSADSNIQIAPGFSHTVFSTWLQATASLSYAKMSYKESSVSALSFMLGPTVNIGANQQDAFFLTAGFVYRSLSKSGTDTATTTSTAEAVADSSGVGFGALLGKRFPIAGPISYRPSIGVYSTGAMAFVVNIFAASYHF